MDHYRHLPIWKASLDLAVHLEHAVRRFGKTQSSPRHKKYTLGPELRQTSQRLCCWVARASNPGLEARQAALDQLVLAQEMQAFANFKEFAQATELAVALSRGGWRRRVRPEAPAQYLSGCTAQRQALTTNGAGYPFFKSSHLTPLRA